MAGALEGVRALELAGYVTGPYAGMLLADLGADVIKVERPGEGDPFRRWDQGLYSPSFVGLNRNKRSVTLNLSDSRGRELYLRLAETADVVIENFRPGVAERLGIGYEEVRRRNPRIVYCSVTAFGETGPYRDLPGYDTIGQAMSGLLGLLTDLEDPMPVGVSLSDHLTGIFAAYGILGALYWRSRTGEGQKVETSLLQATLSFLAESCGRYFGTGEVPGRASRLRLAQAYAFVDRDGLPFVIHLSSPPKFFTALVQAVGRPELAEDERFRSRDGRIRHYDQLHAVLSAVFRERPRSEWLGLLQARGVPCAPVYTMDEVFEDPQVRQLGMTWEMLHPEMGPVRTVGSGIGLERTPPTARAAPPVLGEHTRAVLGSLGLDTRALEEFRRDGVI